MKNTNWTGEYFAGVIRKYVPRDKISHSFLEELKEENAGKILEIIYMKDVIAKCMENSPEMQAVYESPQKLLFYLFKYQGFSNSSFYFASGLNFQNEPVILAEKVSDGQYRKFVSKEDSLSTLYQKYENESSLDIYAGELKKKILNQIGSQLSGRYELIPKFFMMLKIDNHFKMMKCPDYSNFTFVDQNAEIFKNKKREDIERFMHEVYDWDYSLQTFFRDANWFHDKYPVLRCFQDEEKENHLLIAKEVENVLNISMKLRYKSKFPIGLVRVETEEERKLGIVRTLEFKQLEKILNVLKLERSDLFIVPCPIEIVGKVHQVPIPTPYGTFCKLACWSFFELFDELSFGMDLFKGVKPENIRIIQKWFEDLLTDTGVFSTKRGYRYFIETWKLDEIYEKAYTELRILITEPIPRFNYREAFNRKGALTELSKFTENLELKDKQEIDENMRKRIWKEIGDCIKANEVIQIYNESMWDYMSRRVAKMSVFMEIQGFIDVYGPESYEKQKITFTQHSELFKNAFMKFLPNIPFEPILTEREMIAYIRRGMGKDGATEYIVEDQNEFDKFSKFMPLFIERCPKNGEIYVKRKANPGDLPPELFENCEKLSESEVSELIERLTRLLTKSPNEADRQKSNDLIENFNRFLK
ncbi:unnamed protein product [Caenorhabditis angaria]|uniref:Uncharacterized protein n=1 Tax=Caenorhabditis angaria TaxID=860376 RepID=A0A9P1IH15_9PELO|nr:unnamed protein product [Caenorhabditis angaria]